MSLVAEFLDASAFVIRGTAYRRHATSVTRRHLLTNGRRLAMRTFPSVDQFVEDPPTAWINLGSSPLACSLANVLSAYRRGGDQVLTAWAPEIPVPEAGLS
jgi:hypothetical protein